MHEVRTRKLEHLPKGERVLIGEPRPLFGSFDPHPEDEIEICTIASQDPVLGAATLRRQDGGTVRVDYRSGRVLGSQGHLLWTDLLPKGTDDQIAAYCRAVLSSQEGHDRWNRAVLLHVERVENGSTFARPIFPAGSVEAMHPEDRDAHLRSVDVVGNAAFLDIEVELVTGSNGDPDARFAGTNEIESEAPITATVGDLLAAPSLRFLLDGNRMKAAVTGIVRVGNFLTREELGDFIPWSARPIGWDEEHPNPYTLVNQTLVGNEGYLSNEISRAYARAEPNEALVLWYKGPDDRGRSTSYAVLGKRGIVFHEIDNADDYFYGKDDAPGLWVAENVRYWSHRDYEGDYDCGIDCDLRPATAEDLPRFGFSLADLDEEIIAVTDAEALEADEPEQGISARYIDRANAAERSPAIPAPSL